MGRFDDVQQFVREANRMSDMVGLRSLLDSTIRTFGFDYYALVHHASIFQSKGDVIRLHDFPEVWTEVVKIKGYFSDDPVHVACQKSAVPFTWNDVPQLVELTERQKEMLLGARAAGLGGGFTVPIHIPGEYTASCTFSTRLGRDLPAESFPAANYIGSFAFEAARRVSQRMAAKLDPYLLLPPQPRLTRRQLDCVVLAGRGKSDRDVGQILGISDQTVHQHMEDAKRKYDVATRMQLVVRALFDSQLTFADLVH
jgi:LuxR family quorum-sensing system transcriptional regulator CciR